MISDAQARDPRSYGSGRSNVKGSSLTESGIGDSFGDHYVDSADSDSSGESDDESSENIALQSARSSDPSKLQLPSLGRTGGFLGKASMVRMIEEAGEKLMSRVQLESQEGAMSILRLAEPPDEAHLADPVAYKRELQRVVLEEATYYTTDMEHVALENFGADVNPLDVPPREQADAFLNGFFTTLYPFFPIVFEPVFRIQHDEFRRTGVPPSPGAPLQAMFNLIYALGALHAELTASAPWSGEKDSHVIFFVRAMLLSFEPLNTLDLPELHHTQLAGLFGMYFLASNQLNRGWLMIGRAVRFAQNRGFHLINESPGTLNPKIELEVRTWHSISSLERLACFLTGKPAACNGGSAATRPPRHIPEHSALELFDVPLPEGLSFLVLDSPGMLEAFCKNLELDEILSATLVELYAPNVVLKSWHSILRLIDKLNSQMAGWRSSISQRLTIHDGPESEHKAPIIQRVYLALRYFSIIITINRPSFSDDRRRKSDIASSLFGQTADVDNARRCVSAARDMVRMFVSEPDAVELYRASPWWCILHFLVQATTIIVMEISFNAAHLPDQMMHLRAEALKAISCLHTMSEKNAAALRAANTCRRLFDLTVIRNHDAGVSPTLNSPVANTNDPTTSSTASAVRFAKSPAHRNSSTTSEPSQTSYAFPISPIYHAAPPPDESARLQARLVAPHPVYSPTMMWTPPPPSTPSSCEEPDQTIAETPSETTKSGTETNQPSSSRREPTRRGRKERRKR
ncbi:MAG: hypothetical protein Q9160_001896 [Pyrenula sp. 1 TL-2023]